MGNWRTVNITGTIDAAEAADLVRRLTWDQRSDPAKLGPLTISPGVFALGVWPAAVVDARGNLFGSDTSVDDVVQHLYRLVRVAPSMDLVVHCGGEFEDLACVATITARNGQVHKWAPQVQELHGWSRDDIIAAALPFLK